MIILPYIRVEESEKLISSPFKQINDSFAIGSLEKVIFFDISLHLEKMKTVIERSHSNRVCPTLYARCITPMTLRANVFMVISKDYV